jgi:Ser/Thr protein kinase RdoA (MazF antagonist)
MDTNQGTPYAGLTPDCVLDALDSIGLRADGRLLGLNSYENRVYQIWLEEEPAPTPGPGPAPAVVVVVAKFYRPGRWSDAQILEEHGFVRELAERELPVVAPLAQGGRTLHAFGGYRFAVYPKRGGRAPELEQRDTLEWMGASSAASTPSAPSRLSARGRRST